ncbi:MAG: tetraacyldisaccharide 4'-kinase [Proteobacteria bacterium]|nr:tetraacyldisaccharide 4'-kinase [Pseudomonadota bacterium]
MKLRSAGDSAQGLRGLRRREGLAAPESAAAGLQHAWLTRGPLAVALLPLALTFGVAAALRRVAYRLGWARTTRLARPVIVVGNLVAGGAGKTPTVIALVDLLRRHGYTPGIVSRGYGRPGSALVDVTADTPASDSGDEPALLHRRTGAPLVVGRDRAAAGRALLEAHPAVDVIVSDDGLQHLALERDVQVLVFDERGAGNGWLLPAGPLREALPPHVPAKSLVLYNAARPSTPLPGHVARRGLAGIALLGEWHAGASPSMAALHALRGCPVRAVAGIARPDRFFASLRAEGLSIDAVALPDHDPLRPPLPWPADGTDVIVTEKDAVKLVDPPAGTTRVWVAPLDFALEPAFEQALLALLHDAAPGIRDGSPPA